EGRPPGRRPSAAEPDDPRSSAGLVPQTTPIGSSPGHAKVPTEDMAHGVPTPEPLDEYAMRLSVVSAARALAGQVHRPQEDLEGMIWEETGRKLRAGVWPIAAAIMQAKNQVRTDIRNGDR